MTLLEKILSRPNMQRAYQRVMGNKGAAGVAKRDEFLREHLKINGE